jgi:hypothetical protein
MQLETRGTTLKRQCPAFSGVSTHFAELRVRTYFRQLDGSSVLAILLAIDGKGLTSPPPLSGPIEIVIEILILSSS